MLEMIASFVIGMIVAFLLSWYWIRRYGAKIEDKVREKAHELQNDIDDAAKDAVDKIKGKSKDLTESDDKIS